MARRWDPCVSHRLPEVDGFIAEFFGQEGRSVLFIAGAGFDPRAQTVAKKLSKTGAVTRAVLLQEHRPEPEKSLLDRATKNINGLTELFANVEIKGVEIFDTDGAVVGGRMAIEAFSGEDFEPYSDFVVDISALSIGTSFPVIRLLTSYLESARSGDRAKNLHIFTTHNPELDALIGHSHADTPSFVHGFKGSSTLEESTGAAKLWLPQLTPGKNAALRRIHDFLEPTDTCPILPFPSFNPRLADQLAAAYLTELEDAWEVDSRSVVYADEGDPLDLYRTILRLHDLRTPVFESFGGSFVILSPLGSKATALGALMAALEYDLPVAYLEVDEFELGNEFKSTDTPDDVVHIWLEGEAYLPPRPKVGLAVAEPHR